VSVPQSVKDALADAETLRLNLSATGDLPKGPRRTATRRAVAAAETSGRECARWMRARLRSIAPDLAEHYGKEAARDAIRAVPGLRGEQ
jgi:hypothetical protein